VIEPEALLERLVSIDSRNPELSPDSPGEGPVAEATAEVLEQIGMTATLHEVVPGRPNVIGVLAGDDALPSIVLEAHLDTVPGIVPVRREGRRLYGRGTCDTKGSLVSMIGAVERLAAGSGPRPTVLVVGVADEEYVMKGAARLLDQLPEVGGVVVGEPTSLVPVRAHNGFIRVQARVEGVTAHSSKAHLGVNAILGAARAVAALEDELGGSLRERRHPLAGPALLTATMIEGGVAPNVVPDRCEVWLDRRLAPGERPEDALADIDRVLEGVRRGGDRVHLAEPIVALPGLETPADHPFVKAAEEATGRASEGVTYSTDACYLNGHGGLACVVLGPGSIDQAHTADEWIDLDEVVRCIDLYADLVRAAGRVL
jgi:acetylornithine deacetylase